MASADVRFPIRPTVLGLPLLAIMRDEIDAAERAGVRAAAIIFTDAHESGDGGIAH